MLVPGEGLVHGVLQDVGGALRLDVLDRHDDASVVAKVVVVVAAEDLVPTPPAASSGRYGASTSSPAEMS